MINNKSIKLFISMCPNHKYVVNVPKPKQRFVLKASECFVFKISHEKVGESWCHSGAHRSSMLLNEMFTVEDEIIHGQDHTH